MSRVQPERTRRWAPAAGCCGELRFVELIRTAHVREYHLTVDPEDQALDDLADGAAIQDILRDFPSLTEEHVRAAIAFAAAAARDDMPVPAITGTR